MADELERDEDGILTRASAFIRKGLPADATPEQVRALPKPSPEKAREAGPSRDGVAE